MPAPEGNQYAIGNKGGRPTKYDPKFCKEIVEHFINDPYTKQIISTDTNTENTTNEEGEDQEKIKEKIEYKLIANKLPTLEGFAREIGVSKTTILEWAKVHEEFAFALQEAKALYKNFLIQNGLLGLYASNFAKFVAINTTDMKDVKHIEAKGELDISHSIDIPNLATASKLKLDYEEKLKELYSNEKVQGQITANKLPPADQVVDVPVDKTASTED